MIRKTAIAASTMALAGCEGVQTMFGGDGTDGSSFVTLFTIFLIVTAVMYLLVIVGLGVALTRRRGGRADTVEAGRDQRDHPLLRPAIIGWAALIVAGLSFLTLASFVTDRSMARAAAKPALQIEITGNQWWWDIRYMSADPSRIVHTANELHLPVGVPVHITLKSRDVIHSFWVPNLAGKQDLIPGRDVDATLTPTRTGLYRGQCAEFCGVQHANMALNVTVESEPDFRRWYDRQLLPAKPPASSLAMAGYRYVTTRECAMCHAVAGTPASGSVAPDLTHLASRRTIAAGALPMSEGNLYGWVADPQSQKPGTKMPTLGLEPDELHAVVAYLETLK